MTLHPSGNSREQILIMGSWGAGKSYAWLCCAKRLPDNHFYIIDTTHDAERMVEGEGLENVTITYCPDYEDWRDAIKKYNAEASRDDFLVADLMGDLWPASQRYYSEEVFGKEIDDWFLSAKKEAMKQDKGVGGIISGSHGENWGMINRAYQAVMMNYLRFPGHKIAITGADTISEPDNSGKGGDSIELRQLFNKFKLKPTGQKALGFQFHTIMLMREKSAGNWIMDTIRDRNREVLTNETVNDFAMQYLVKVAKWRP